MYTIYQVEYGDSLDKIASKANTTVENIKKINSINSDSDLIVGGLIIIPKKSDRVFENYKVKTGDTIYSIAKEYDVDPNTLLLLNGLKKDDYIYPNQELLVPEKDIIIYVTRDGDTIDGIITNLGIDANTLNQENGRIFVLSDQLIVHKKEGNN